MLLSSLAHHTPYAERLALQKGQGIASISRLQALIEEAWIKGNKRHFALKALVYDPRIDSSRLKSTEIDRNRPRSTKIDNYSLQ